ncbi:MAG: hypothetical protein JNK02_07850 [Planctomycetes bacterium]|nr:hypothetical protein [Planctomycetota bacterium]
MHVLTRILATLALAGCAAAQTFVEGFTNGSNQGAWTWGAGDQIVATGGNPGHYLRTQVLDTFAPQPRTGAGVTSPFTGDYRARGVTAVGIDLITLGTQFNFQREVTLILENDGGTPGSVGDDLAVYLISPGFVPQPGTGWASFDVPIPAQSATLPPGWQVLQGGGSPNQVWNAVLTNVSRVRWFYGNPEFFFIFDIWQVGLDNPRITSELGTAFCFGDGSGTACPCGNASAAPRGCANSTGQGAQLVATGSPSLAANDLVISASGLPGSAPVLLFHGTAPANGGAGFVFGDGLRCVGGTVTRVGTRQAQAGVAQWGPGLGLSLPFPQTVHFQSWYRNVAGPCGSGWNLSSARSITFTP